MNTLSSALLYFLKGQNLMVIKPDFPVSHHPIFYESVRVISEK